MRRLTALLAPLTIAAVLLVPASASAASPVAASRAASPLSTGASSAGLSAKLAISGGEYQTDVQTLTNRERSKKGLATLKKGTCIDGFANSWAKKMATSGKLVHQSLTPIMSKCKLSWVGENIAYGYSTPKAVVAAWMKSQGHRENILRPQFRLLGVGYWKDSKGVVWVSQVFGTPR